MTPVESVSRTEPFAAAPAIAAPTVDVATPPLADATPVADAAPVADPTARMDATTHADATTDAHAVPVGDPMAGSDATSAVADDAGTLPPAMKSE